MVVMLRWVRYLLFHILRHIKSIRRARDHATLAIGHLGKLIA